MVFFIGIAMMGGYFGLIEFIIPYTQTHYPSLSPVVFIIVSIIYCTIAMRAQTRVERFFINRHVRKNPESTWRYANGSAD